ncbi:microtubule-associated protein futsch-like [Haliotis asinina]|uniref:microtubule-associated protein futsch-like n=1 Tax=Haliotis asinina TaxID=109174 RepID=UPI003532717C
MARGIQVPSYKDSLLLRGPLPEVYMEHTESTNTEVSLSAFEALSSSFHERAGIRGRGKRCYILRRESVRSAFTRGRGKVHLPPPSTSVPYTSRWVTAHLLEELVHPRRSLRYHNPKEGLQTTGHITTTVDISTVGAGRSRDAASVVGRRHRGVIREKCHRGSAGPTPLARFLLSGLPHSQRSLLDEVCAGPLQGWGGCLNDQTISGFWSDVEAGWHINSLELEVVILAVSHWVPLLRHSNLLTVLDNQTVMWLILRQGTTRSKSLSDQMFRKRKQHQGQSSLYPRVGSVAAPSPHSDTAPRPCLDHLQRTLRAMGYSSQVAKIIARAHRASTRSSYDDKWATFEKFCAQKLQDPLGTLPPITSTDLVSPRSNHSMQSSDSSMSSRYSSSSFNSDLTSTYKIVSTSLSQAPTHQPRPPVQPLRRTLQEPLCIQTVMSHARPASARLAERRYLPVDRNAFLVKDEDKEMYSPRSLKLDRASSTTDLLPRFDNYTQTPRDSATQTPRRFGDQINTEDILTNDTSVDQETQTPRSSRHGLKKKRRKKYENLELTSQSSDATESVDSDILYEDRRSRKRNKLTGVSSASDSFRSTSTQDFKTKVCQTSFSIESEESFTSLHRRHRNMSETITLKSVDEDNPASSLPNSTVHLFKEENMSDSVFDSEEQNGRYIGSAIDLEKRADVGSSEEYVAYDRADEGEKTTDMKEPEQLGPPDTEKQREDFPQTVGNESHEDSFWETRGVTDSPHDAVIGNFGEENVSIVSHNDPKDQASTQDTSQLESVLTKESESNNVDSQMAVVNSEICTVSPENVTVEEPASADTAVEVVKTDPEVAVSVEDAKNLSDSFDDVCRGTVELPSFEEDPRGDRIFSDIDGTMEEYRGIFLNNLSETFGSDSSSRYQKFPSNYMYVPEDRGSDGDTLVDSDTDPEVYTKSEKIFTREETDEQLEMDEELCRGEAPVKRKNSEASSYCSATRAQGEITPMYQEVAVSRANSVTSQTTQSSVRGSRISAWKKDPKGRTAPDQSEKSEQTAELDQTQDLLNDEDFLEVTEDYEAKVVKGPNAVTADVDRTSSCSRGSGDKVQSPASEMPSRGEEEFLNLETSRDEMKRETVDIPVDTENIPALCSLSTSTGDVKKISVSEVDTSSPVPADTEIQEADTDIGDDGNKIKEDTLESGDSESRGHIEKTQHDLTMSSRGGDELGIEPFSSLKDENSQMQETHDNSELDLQYEPAEDREEFDTAVSEVAASETKDETTTELGAPRPDSSCSTSRGFVLNGSSLQGSSQAASSRGHQNDETVASFVECTVAGDREDTETVDNNATDYVNDDNFSSETKQLQVPTAYCAEERGNDDLFLTEGNELGVSKMSKMVEISGGDCDFKENKKSELSREGTSKNIPSDDEVFYSDPSVSKPMPMRPVSACCIDSTSVSPSRPISACHVPPLKMGSTGLKEDTAIPDKLYIEAGNTGDDIYQIPASDPKDLISHDESRGQIDTTLNSEVILCEGEEQVTSHFEELRMTEDTQILEINSVKPPSTKDETVNNSINIILDVGASIKSATLTDNQRRPVSAHGMRSDTAHSPRERPVSAHHRQMSDMVIEGSSGDQCGTVTESNTIAHDDISNGNSGMNEGETVRFDESRGQMDVQGDPTDKENAFEEKEKRESETELQEEMEPAVPEMLTLIIEQSSQQDISSQMLTPVNTRKDDIEKVQTMEPNADSEEKKAEQEDVTDLDMLTEHPERPGSSLSIERGETTNTPRPAPCLARTKVERSDSVCSRGSEIDDSGNICLKECEEQKTESGDKKSVDQRPGSVSLDPVETHIPVSKPDSESHSEGQSLEINAPIADETDTNPRNITHDGQEDVDVVEVVQEQASQISAFQDVKEGQEPIYVSSRRGSITHRDAVLSKAVLTGVLSPTPSTDNEESCMPIVYRGSQTHGSHDDTQQGKNVALHGDVMTNLKTTDLSLIDDNSDEKPAPNNLISKDSVNFFSFDVSDGSKLAQSFTSSEESVTLQTSTDTVMNDSTESSTTCNTTNTTNTLEEQYTRTELIPDNVSQDSSGIRYAVLESNSGIHTAPDVLGEKMDETLTAEIKSNYAVSHEDALGCEEVDKDHSPEDGTSPVGTLRPLSVLGLPQKDLSNRRLSLESRGSSEFIIETDEVPIVSSRGDEILPENTVGELPTNDNLPESQTFINGYLRIKPTVFEHQGDEGEEAYCSLAAPSACPDEACPVITQKGPGDIKVINSPSQPSPLESKLADYLGNVNMNSLIAVVDESPVDVDYTKSGKSNGTSYHLVLNEEHCEPDHGSQGDGKVKGILSKAPDDKDSSRCGIKSLGDKSELSVVTNVPAVSIDPHPQEINRTYKGMTHLKEEPIGKRKAVTFVDGHLPQEDIGTWDLSPQDISKMAETQDSNKEKLTNEAMLKSKVMMPEVILHQGSDNQGDMKPPMSVHDEKSLYAATLQADTNHVTETLPESGVSEDTRRNPNKEPTSDTNLLPGHHRQSTSLHGQTVVTDAETPSRLSEEVDEHKTTSETTTNQGHLRQLTSVHGQTVIADAEVSRRLTGNVKEPEDKTSSNPLRGNPTLSTSLPGTIILNVAEAGQLSGGAAIVQSSNGTMAGQVEHTSEHRVIAVSECEGLPDKAPHEHVTQGQEQNRMNPPQNEEQKEEAESEQLLGDTENTDARNGNDQLSNDHSDLKPVTVSDSLSNVQEHDATGLNGGMACGRQQTISSKHVGMSVSGNMDESYGQSVSESKRGLHSDQTSGHRIILVSESLPNPAAKATVIERRPGGSRVILVSEKSEV